MWYGLAWASFGALHSVLVADSVKTALGLGRYTRLAYNGFAVLHLGGIWWLGKFWLSDAAPLGLTPAVEMIGNGVSVLGLVVITVALLGYDRDRFLGTTQLRAPETANDEDLRIDGSSSIYTSPAV